jgi:predicted CXXCH cytochrome family protein
MTELPSAVSVRAPWHGTLEWQGRAYVLTERAGEYWVRLPDPDRVAQAFAHGATHTPGPEVAPDVERKVALTTGSHHYQAYWVPGARGNELWQMPFVYHFQAQRFLPRHEVFLQPPEDPPYMARWNSNCVQCHSVGGEPQHQLDGDRFETRVAELGVACEACHGPGREHVRARQEPPAPRSVSGNGPADGSIVNPARLDAERASELCGQCHSYFVPRDPQRWWQSGFAGHYRPGDALDETRTVLDYERDRAGADALISVGLDSLFYTDGTIRVGGREWNGLARSACFERGTGDHQASCLSCHRMHGGTRDDQLAPGDENDACDGCHSAIASAGAAHTHHAPLSSGSQCLNCHMPHTTYALFKPIRAHRITRPLVDPRPGAAPNACNLCHLDQSLAWTATWLSRWYGVADPLLEPALRGASRAVLPDGRAPHELALAAAVLHGNAAERVIVADRLAWDASLTASGSGWQAPLLRLALEDPYAAVRFVARRSLAALGARAAGPRSHASPPAPPFARDYSLDPALLEQLRATRDDTPVRIAE